jgi:hypothetical protein
VKTKIRWVSKMWYPPRTGYECKMCPGMTQFFLREYEWGNGKLWDKIATILLYWLHLISLANLTFSVSKCHHLWSCKLVLPLQNYQTIIHMWIEESSNSSSNGGLDNLCLWLMSQFFLLGWWQKSTTNFLKTCCTMY